MTILTKEQIEWLAQDIFDAYLNGPDNPSRVEQVEKIIAESLEEMDREMTADKDDDKLRWRDVPPQLNANARAEEEFGKRLEMRGPGER